MSSVVPSRALVMMVLVLASAHEPGLGNGNSGE